MGERFQKGHKKLGGRKKGTPNKRMSVVKILAEKGREPVSEILALIPNLSERDQIAAWFELLSYIDAKPKVIEAKNEGESLNDKDLTIDDILEIVDVTPQLLEHKGHNDE